MNNGRRENDSVIREAIVKTVAYFDMFDWPLTVGEIWLNLGVKCELGEVMEGLKSLAAKESKNGFYFLAGRSQIVAERFKRYDFTARKFKRAMTTAWLFKFIPWVKLVAMANLFGDHNLKDSSDIDLFIITGKNRLWISRWFCVGLIKLLGWRPDLAKSIYRDRICLSFFVSQASLNLDRARLKDDIHFAHWLAGLKPVYEKEPGAYEEFIRANGWLKEVLPNWQPPAPVSRRRVKPGALAFYHEVADLFLGGLEPQAKKLQLKILPRRVRQLMNQSTNVMIDDLIIKTHVNDRREEYRKRYEEKINEIFSENN